MSAPSQSKKTSVRSHVSARCPELSSRWHDASTCTETRPPLYQGQPCPQPKRLAHAYRTAESNRTQRRRPALHGAFDPIGRLCETRHKRQQQLAGNDRRAFVQFAHGALHIGVNPVAITCQRDETIDFVLRHRSPTPGGEFPAHKRRRDRSLARHEWPERPVERRNPAASGSSPQSPLQTVASNALPRPPAAAIARQGERSGRLRLHLVPQPDGEDRTGRTRSDGRARARRRRG